MPGGGFRRGNYKCQCTRGYFFPPSKSSNHQYYNGSTVEQSYIDMLSLSSSDYNSSFQCLPCKKGCTNCSNNKSCKAEYDVMLRGVPLGIQSFCMTIALVLGFVIIRLRTSKVRPFLLYPCFNLFIIIKYRIRGIEDQQKLKKGKLMLNAWHIGCSVITNFPQRKLRKIGR